MKKMKYIHNKIYESFKTKIILCASLSAIVILGFLLFNRTIDKKRFYEYTITNNIDIINLIEHIYIDNDNTKLDGYAFLMGKDSIDTYISLFLISVNSGKDIWLDTEHVSRADVNSHYLSEYNYENSGFSASLNNRDLKDDECYEIMINIDYIDNRFDKIRTTVSSNRFILNGQLYEYNPYEFDKPSLEVQSELLYDVFTNGQLCYYNNEAGMYIYQYEGKLYWIANSSFLFNENGQTYIPYHLFTSQINRLPAERVQYAFDNLDFFFEQYEYKDDATDPYRVAIQEIPYDYPITYVKTGHFDLDKDTWVWSGSFQLNNQFKQRNFK